MPTRFAFRQIDKRDLAIILRDGEIRSKNHSAVQRCHQTSHPQIVGFRDGSSFDMPYGGVVNDYVPFYFSPVTAFSFAIHRGGVEVKDPEGMRLGMSTVSDRIFLVCKVSDVYETELRACYSDYALNSLAPMPTVISDFDRLESHVRWPLFDEAPTVARIQEIGYEGVCQYFKDCTIPVERQKRKSARMAEFLTKDTFPTSLLSCIVAPNEAARKEVAILASKHGFRGHVLSKPGCFVS